ncbi:MAG: cyclic nucleotide-binding domain-containing protein, partial [Anaerolineae bacterium]
ALGPVDPDDTILEIGERCRLALLLTVDRLDDLAGTPFTRQAGQAAYDSLPWPEAETLARHALAEMEWGVQLAQGFIRQRDQRRDLVRRADIFVGFDQEAVAEVLAVLEAESHPKRALLARQGHDARRFYLIAAGDVGVFHEDAQVATLHPGGYFGVNALLDQGEYHFTYRALTAVHLLAIPREKFDPLLRADTTLTAQVTAGAESRHLLKQMPLFGSLSPQELEMVDRRLQQRRVQAGEVIVRQGEPRSFLFIVLNGRVQVVMASDGRPPQVVGSLGIGEHFGEYALYADTPYTATYRAEEDCRLLLLDEPTFDKLVADYETMSHYVEQIGSGRLIATRRRVGAMAVFS